MGKRLIIKGADFSKNGIQYSLTWYSNNVNKTGESLLVFGNSVSTGWEWNNNIYPGYALYEQFRGKPVNIVRTRINDTFRNKAYAMKLKYHIFYMEATAVNTEYEVLRELMSFTLSADDIKKDIIEIRLPETITLSNDNLSGISIGCPITNLPTEALDDFNNKGLSIPCIRLFESNLYHINSSRQFLLLSDNSLAFDYGYEH